MFKFVCTSSKSSFRTSTITEFILIQICPFSSASSSVVKTRKKSIADTSSDDKQNQHSFTVNYLIKRCGLSEKSAISASKYLHFETPDRPDSVLAVFKKYGFTDAHVSAIVRGYPRILLCRPGKTILPKIEFFQSLGLKDLEISRILSSRGKLLGRSLQTQIIPSCNVLRDMFASYQDLACPMGRCSDILTQRFQRLMAANIEVLRNVGIPEPNILHLLKNQPRVFGSSSDIMKESAKNLQKMGLNPGDKSFAKCLWRMASMNNLVWDRKVAVYKIWGCSENQVLVAFKKHSCVMAISEGKINDVMNFLVHKMDYNSSAILKTPSVLSLSLQKTIVPRCSVCQVLLAKGLINKNPSLSSLLICPEKIFLGRYVECFENEAAKLLKIYRENLELSK